MSGLDDFRPLIERLRTERGFRRGVFALVLLNAFVVAVGLYKMQQVGGGVIAGAISAVVVIGLSAIGCGFEIWVLSRILQRRSLGKTDRMSDIERESERVRVWKVERPQGEPIPDYGKPAPHVTPADEAAADEGGPGALLYSGRTMRGTAAWMRRWAWAISLVGTILGFGVTLPIVHSQFSVPRLLVLLPLTWLIVFFIARSVAKWIPKTLFPGEE